MAALNFALLRFFIMFLAICVPVVWLKDTDQMFDLGFQLKLQESSVLWRQGLTVDATCIAKCSNGCEHCNNLIFKLRTSARNVTFTKTSNSPDFTMYSIQNFTQQFSKSCEIHQKVTFHKIRQNDTGSIFCESATSSSLNGLAFLAVFLNVSYTNFTVPTKQVIKTVEFENGFKFTVYNNKYNVTSKPFLSCKTSGGGSGTEFAWQKEDGSVLTTVDDATATRDPSSGTNPVNQVFSILTFNKITEKAAMNVGRYNCTIAALKAYGVPVLEIAPIVKLAAKDYTSGVEKDSYRQKCSVVAYPLATIVWFKNNVTLVANDRIKFENDNKELVITSLEKEDKAVYVCSATNYLGTGQAYIKLRVKDRYAALYPFLGIVAEIIILVAIILCYEKKRANKKRAKEVQDNSEIRDDRNNVNDSELRYRSVKA